ncbi:type II toxin-antitoxin system RelE family toxin [Cypionkella sinensis]|uniref:Type II toxin-antitoxin system RelE/ParE family toxin n=1 Tax=Cypionkella sinensis TaxID=1756043 RepID=A0ABV7J637_9RHOB
MEFRIADTFTDSLARLTSQEQKVAKTTAFDLQLDPSSNGLSFHKLDRAKDTNFWSVRVNADIRIIVHRTASSILLVYVDHHDDAYKWAERRKIERPTRRQGRCNWSRCASGLKRSKSLSPKKHLLLRHPPQNQQSSCSTTCANSN